MPLLWNCETLRIFYSTFVSDVTRILDAAQKGDPKAAEELLPLVYDELRKLAAAKMAQERPGHTLQPTALVHDPPFAPSIFDKNASHRFRSRPKKVSAP